MVDWGIGFILSPTCRLSMRRYLGTHARSIYRSTTTHTFLRVNGRRANFPFMLQEKLRVRRVRSRGPAGIHNPCSPGYHSAQTNMFPGLS